MEETRGRERGGARPGAGRPPLPPDQQRYRRNFGIRQEALAVLQARATRDGLTISEALNRCVIEWATMDQMQQEPQA